MIRALSCIAAFTFGFKLPLNYLTISLVKVYMHKF